MAHSRDAYSPLVSSAAAQAAHVMSRVVAPMIGGAPNAVARMSPNLRAVLTTMLERTARQGDVGPTRLAMDAPELVTPPAPRPNDAPVEAAVAPEPTSMSSADRVAHDVSTQRAQIVELQRAARVVAEREYAARVAAVPPPAPVIESRPSEPTRVADPDRQKQAAALIEERVAQRLAERTTAGHAQQAQQAQERETVQRTVEQQREVAQQEQRRRATARRELVVEQQQRVTTGRREQRLHEQAREAAARDARSSAVESAPAEAPRERAVPQEIIAAIAALPPELASMLASGMGQRPERAVAAIGELGEALRTIELLARNTAAGGSFESSRGPRLVMPAGLGGLVATVDRATVVPTERRAPRMSTAAATAPITTVTPAMFAPQPAAAPTLRMPTMPWLSAPADARRVPIASSGTPTTALGATAASTPAALHHVAWADRWLARFSGARGPSLDLLTASASSPETRMQALAAAAPGTVFVSPMFDATTDARATSTAIETATANVQAAQDPSIVPMLPTAAPASTSSAIRYDDSAETPDDVFSAISAAAARTRGAATGVPQPDSITMAAVGRDSIADHVAHAVPSAPGAGLSAQLGSSPFAPAFRHMFPLASSPSFDVRALLGGGLGATYLAGLLSPATRELAIGAHELPAWAAEPATMFAPDAVGAIGAIGAIDREVADFQPEYVAARADAVADAVAQRDESVAAEMAEPTPTMAATPSVAALAPLTTLRSALLSWDVDTLSMPGGATETRVGSPSIANTGSSASTDASTVRSMIEGMSLPMLDSRASTGSTGSHDGALDAGTYSTFAAPGMIADRAHGWSVAQERSTSDLAYDFVTPELVLAARVYGLGPAEAAQAARLAIAGPGHLGAMASTVDRTFVQAMAIEAERRDRVQTLTAYPRTPASSDAAPAFDPVTGEQTIRATAPSTQPSSSSAVAQTWTAPVAPQTAFGVDRRLPRGAFMWPAATIAALGLNAATPDGDHSMSVAALELLAAQSVASLGTYAALGFDRPPVSDDARGDATATAASTSPFAVAATATSATSSSSSSTSTSSTSTSLREEAEPNEQIVLATATALVPTARRAKFEAMYVALGQSPAGRSWSPSARAARALALAGRGEDSITAHERAAIAWEVMPVVAPSTGELGSVLGTDGASFTTGSPSSSVMTTGSAATRAIQRQQAARARGLELPEYVESRPGLAALSARAGEALGSYVTPTVAPSASSSSSSSSSSSQSREQGAVMRAPTAAQEFVKTGRSGGRYGGGEVEIPNWFEAAARKMLDERSGNSDGISLAELTLVTAAPSTQIAAATRGVPSAAPANSNPSTSGAQANAAQQVDIEKVANEVYKQILVLMDAARGRNGEPYL